MPAQPVLLHLFPILHSACLLLHLQLCADSWACFTEAQKEALVWGCANSQSLNQNQPLSLINVGKLQAGQETQSRGQQCIPALTPSQVPGAAFQGLLQSQLTKLWGEMAAHLYHDHLQNCPLYCCPGAQSQKAHKFGLCHHPCSEVPCPQMLHEATTLQGCLVEAGGHVSQGR